MGVCFMQTLLGHLLVSTPRPTSAETYLLLWDFSDTSLPVPMARAKVARS